MLGELFSLLLLKLKGLSIQAAYKCKLLYWCIPNQKEYQAVIDMSLYEQKNIIYFTEYITGPGEEQQNFYYYPDAILVKLKQKKKGKESYFWDWV